MKRYIAHLEGTVIALEIENQKLKDEIKLLKQKPKQKRKKKNGNANS
jgi:hypothetical protein